MNKVETKILWESKGKTPNGDPFSTIKEARGYYSYLERGGVDSIAFILYDKNAKGGKSFGIIYESKPPRDEVEGKEVQMNTAFGGSIDCINNIKEDSMAKKLTQEIMLERFHNKHSDRYNYSKSKFVTSKSPVTITCKEHGDFEQKPENHWSGQNCMKCTNIDRGKNQLRSQDKVIENFRLIHGNLYNYDKVDYIGNDKKVIITCFKHGDFLQEPKAHINGNKCPKCRKYHSYFRDRSYYTGKKTILYHIFLDEYMVYKIGLTVSTIQNRFKTDNVKYTILSETEFENGEEAWDLEQKLLNETFNDMYEGPKLLASGNTELRNNKIIKSDTTYQEICQTEVAEEAGYEVPLSKIHSVGKTLVSSQMSQMCEGFLVDVTGIEKTLEAEYEKKDSDEQNEKDHNEFSKNRVDWFDVDELMNVNDWKSIWIWTKTVVSGKITK